MPSVPTIGVFDAPVGVALGIGVVWIQDTELDQYRRNCAFRSAGCSVCYLERNAKLLLWKDRDEKPFGPGFNGDFVVEYGTA